MKTILKNKWHLHTGLSIVAAILFLFLTDKFPNFMDIGNTGNFLQIFLTVFVCLCTAGFIEWVQSKFFGATETKASYQDIVVSVLGSIIGVITYYIFTSIALPITLILFIIIAALEVIRKFFLNY